MQYIFDYMMHLVEPWEYREITSCGLNFDVSIKYNLIKKQVGIFLDRNGELFHAIYPKDLREDENRSAAAAYCLIKEKLTEIRNLTRREKNKFKDEMGKEWIDYI
jgi:hypothetical protein